MIQKSMRFFSFFFIRKLLVLLSSVKLLGHSDKLFEKTLWKNGLVLLNSAYFNIHSGGKYIVVLYYQLLFKWRGRSNKQAVCCVCHHIKLTSASKVIL